MDNDIKLTYNDRRFLRQIHIDPEASVEQTLADILCGPGPRVPDAVIISASVAREIAREYGELTLETFQRWRLQHGN